ncbi:hypothetical protein [Novipirellula caenicola]|uniref:Uncharacterized protein n=1 Tax=Novipirellula caenicola TaxID=1536901 RepID=A0ABP9VNC4_9BACT
MRIALGGRRWSPPAVLASLRGVSDARMDGVWHEYECHNQLPAMAITVRFCRLG